MEFRMSTCEMSDTSLYAAKLKACGESRDLVSARQVHEDISSSEHRGDRFLANLTMDMYGKCGSLREARAVFETIPDPNVFSWNILMSVYALNGHLQEARAVFDNTPNRNVVSWNTIISGYVRSGQLHEANELFEKMPSRNQVSWNTMISAYAENGDVGRAEELFEKMPDKDVVSCSSMLAAYAHHAPLHQAEKHFLCMPKKNEVSWIIMIQAYGRHGKVEEARRIFNDAQERTVVTWTTMISVYGRSSRSKEAFRLFKLMDLEGVQPNDVTLAAVADACAHSPTQSEAKLLHASVCNSRYRSDLVVATALINLHGRCGCLKEARELFDGVRERDLVIWTAMITAYAHNGNRDRARCLFQSMELEGVQPNDVTYMNVLSGSACSGLVDDARTYFISMVGDYKIPPRLDHYIRLVHVLGRAGRLSQAEELLATMPFEPDHASWTILLGACQTHLDVERGSRAAERASELTPETSSSYLMLSNIYAASPRAFSVMAKTVSALNSRTSVENSKSCGEAIEDHSIYAKKLRACAETKDLFKGRRVHLEISSSRFSNDRFLANLAIDMYGKCGSVKEAREVFDRLHERNIFTWNIMIAAYALNGHVHEARLIFDKIPERNIVSWNTMISAYTQNGQLQMARLLFEKMPNRNQVSWNAMISAYAERGEMAKAEELFENMPDKNTISWSAMLAAYAQSGCLLQAKRLFVRMPDKNVISWTTMMLAYVKNNQLEQAREMFDKMPERNVVTWTTMIGAYGRNSQSKESFRLFKLMDLDGIQPNAVTFVTVTDACSVAPTQAEAKLLHAALSGTVYKSDLLVATSLINLHGRCGCLTEARSLFDGTCDRDLVLWTAMITAYAHNSLRAEALHLFQAMELEGLQPNEITYINVLSGSAYSGVVEDAWSYFMSMVDDYGIPPLMDHYIGMIHVLGRAGRLAQAEELVISMPFEADYVSWMTLLSACETHVDVERGIRAADKASELNPDNSSPYVVLSNICAATGDELGKAKLAEALQRHKKPAKK